MDSRLRLYCATQVYKSELMEKIRMANSAYMDRDIERALTNTMKVCLQTGKLAPKLTEKQLKALREYKEYYEELPSPRGGKNKLASVWNAVMQIRRLGLFLKGQGVETYKEAKKEHILAYIKSLNRNSDMTRSRALTYIRMFYKWIYGIKDKYKYPEVVDDPRLVPEKTKNKKKPQDLLKQEEIKKLLDVAQNYRNRCIVMLSVGEGGMRSGEIASLNISSVEFDDKGCKVWIEKSKSKERYVRFIKAEPYLREYINKEYSLDKSNPSNPLFYGHASYSYLKRLRGSAFTELLQRLGKKAGIKKRIYTHLGRAINISLLTKKGMSAEISAKRFGITPATLRNVYLTIDDKDVDDSYLKLNGKLSDDEKVNLEEESKILAPKVCPRCNIKLPVNALYCNCGMVVNQNEAIRIQQDDEFNRKALELVRRLSSISPESLEQFFSSIDRIKDKEQQIIKNEK